MPKPLPPPKELLSLRAFTKQRAGLLDLLGSPPATEWSRGSTVTGAGKPLRLTIHRYVERLAIHERAHVKQIERMIRT